MHPIHSPVSLWKIRILRSFRKIKSACACLALISVSSAVGSSLANSIQDLSTGKDVRMASSRPLRRLPAEKKTLGFKAVRKIQQYRIHTDSLRVFWLSSYDFIHDIFPSQSCYSTCRQKGACLFLRCLLFQSLAVDTV